MNTLNTEFLSRFANLHLAVKALASGVYSGAYRSRFQEAGSEFSDYRAYVQGDDLRMMDWRASARSDRDYIRVTHREKDRSCMVVIRRQRVYVLPGN